MSDHVLPPHLARTGRHALQRVDRLYHIKIKHALDSEGQREYEEATALWRGLVTRAAADLALADFDHDLLWRTFGVTRDPSVSEMLKVNYHEMSFVDAMLAGAGLEANAQATPRPDDEAKPLGLARLEELFDLTLKGNQRHGRNDLGRPKLMSPEVAANMQDVHWSTQNVISLPVTYEGRLRRLHGVLDYMLLCGARARSEAKLVVVTRKRRGRASIAREEALVAMCEFPKILLLDEATSGSRLGGMIHAVRMASGKADCRIFGLGTDGHEFHFISIDNDSRYSYRLLEWLTPTDESQIHILLSQIMREAATLPPERADSDLEEEE
ncbi:hypothetical protein BJY00DRAFT_320086 [Aspergillus carlsbadensis]|nr:hypothetical protein BJY00DRAFT_320086 [Aspergillus carlsbadensis]